MLPADTHVKRLVDRALPRTGLPAVLYFAVIVVLLNVGPPLVTVRLNLALIGVASLAAGAWCSLNFWRCRHAHCVITGVGWSLLALFSLAEAALGRSLIAGYEDGVFLVVLGLGLAFEAVWRRAHGSNAIAGMHHPN